MVQLKYSVQQTTITFLDAISSIATNKGLKLSQFIHCGYFGDENKGELLEHFIMGLHGLFIEKQEETIGKNAKYFNSPDLLPFLRVQPITPEEFKEIILDALTVLDFDKIPKMKYKHSGEFGKLLEESTKTYMQSKKTSSGSLKTKFLKKIFHKK